MNLVFLCISLEPGRDGVGDYTRQLASELIRQGHQIAIVALNDKALAEEWNGVQTANSISIPVLRIPATWPAKQRFERAKQWIDVIDPQWLSLQYVPFGFHRKGLPFGLGRSLQTLGQGRQWHVMFHELWVGMEKEATPKFKVWGYIQKYLIWLLINQLSPACIHTHSQTYQAYLARMGFTAARLPLFSNIKQEKSALSSNHEIRIVVFGAIHSLAPIDQFVSQLAHYRDARNVRISVAFAGRSGNELSNWMYVWGKAGFEVDQIGEQPSTVISEILNRSTVGLSTTAFAIVEKSSAIATMQAHGLPVICISRPWTPRGITSPAHFPGINQYSGSNLAACLDFSTNQPLTHTLSSVANLLVGSLALSAPYPILSDSDS